MKPEQHAPRVEVSIKSKPKAHLENLVTRNVIVPVQEPTKWINSMVAVCKPGKLYFCVDQNVLKLAIKRPHYPLPTIDDVLPKLYYSQKFSVLNAKQGFWQIELDESSFFFNILDTIW